MLLQTVMTGNRIFVALYGLSVLVSCWIYGRKRIILACLALSPVILLVFSAWASLRGDLGAFSEKLPAYVEQDLGDRATTTLIDATEGASVMQLLHMVNDFGEKFNYFYGLSYTKAVTFIVPRSLYPGKTAEFPCHDGTALRAGRGDQLRWNPTGRAVREFRCAQRLASAQLSRS